MATLNSSHTKCMKLQVVAISIIIKAQENLAKWVHNIIGLAKGSKCQDHRINFMTKIPR